MTIFGWALLALFTLMLFNAKDNPSRILCMFVIFGLLAWGTGSGIRT